MSQRVCITERLTYCCIAMLALTCKPLCAEPIQTFTGHTGGVAHVAFSPDGSLLISSGGDRSKWEIVNGGNGQHLEIKIDNFDTTVRLWDVKSGKEVRQCVGHTKEATNVLFSPDGLKILTSGHDQSVKVWALDGTLLASLDNLAGVPHHLTFLDNGTTCMSVERDRAIVWDLNQKQAIRSIMFNPGAGVPTRFTNSIATSKDGKLIAGRTAETKNGKHTIILRRTDREVAPLTIDVDSTVWNSMALSPDGHFLASAGKDNIIQLWDTTTGKEVRQFKGHVSHINSIAFSPDGSRLLSGSGMYQTKGNREVILNGKLVPIDCNVYLWDVKTGVQLQKYLGHTDVVLSVTFSPDGRLAASGSRDLTIKTWKLPEAR